MKRFFLWFALLNKRLARRASFWLILAAVPLLVLALGLLADQESGDAAKVLEEIGQRGLLTDRQGADDFAGLAVDGKRIIFAVVGNIKEIDRKQEISGIETGGQGTAALPHMAVTGAGLR